MDNETENMTLTELLKYQKRGYILKLIISVSLGLILVTVLTTAMILVPKAVRLMNSAQRTIDNMETISEDLKALELAEAIKTIEDNTAQAMSDVSGAMEQVEKLDVDTLNQSIQELKESTERFNILFGK